MYPLLSSLLLRDRVRVQDVWRPGEKGEKDEAERVRQQGIDLPELWYELFTF